MSHRKQGWSIVVTCVAAAAVALVWWRGDKPASSSPLAPQQQVTAAVAEREPEVANLGAPQMPLPDEGTPLRLVFDGLKQRANDGDARAACRLAAELEQCERVRTELAQFDDLLAGQQRMLARQDDPKQRARMREDFAREGGSRGQQLLQESEQCDGAPALAPAARADLWRQAALGGSLPALTQYAVGNAFRTRDTLQLLPQLQVYRNEAESLAMQAAQRGSLKATLALAGAYSPRRDAGHRTYLAQVVTPDASKSLALYLRAQQDFAQVEGPLQAFRTAMFERNIDWLRENATPEQVEAGETLARQWQQQWATTTAPDISGTFSFDGGVSDIAPQHCGQ